MTAHAETVHSAQRTFRTLLDALAHPGREVPLDDLADVPEPLSRAVGAAARALFDREVSVWTDRSDVARWLAATTGTRTTEEPASAAFVVITEPRTAPSLLHWNAGTPEDPEESATLLVQAESLSGGRPMRLTGPGIDGERIVAPYGIAPNFWAEWTANAARYPLGIDVLVFGAAAVIGLPRTVQARPA